VADGHPHLSHLLVENRSADEGFHRPGRGNTRLRPVEDRTGHGTGRLGELRSAIANNEEQRSAIDQLTEEELRALGSIVTLEGDDPAYPLRVDSLQRLSAHTKSPKRPWWLLLSVTPGDSSTGIAERAMVWVSDEHREKFLKLFEDYLAANTTGGKPKNNNLVANIARIRSTILSDLWQSDGEPPSGRVWWEVWLRPGETSASLLRLFARAYEARVSDRVLVLPDRVVTWIHATWSDLEILPFTAVPVAEIRRPEFVDTVEDLPEAEQDDYVEDLAQRTTPASEGSPAVCHLDTGVARTHLLLEGSLSAGDLHTVIGTSGFDQNGHGTAMAGVALLGDVDGHLIGTHPIRLRHRLESVRIFPFGNEAQHNPLAYGDVTAQAISLPEIASTRQRVFCMPISSDSDTPTNPGQPTLWSATVDALAAGTAVVRAGDELQLLAPPDPYSTRLIVVSAGNVKNFKASHLDESDTSPVQDPGQAWNALTVGAHTEMVSTPTDPQYAGWTAVAPTGELSPHSRTSLLFGRRPWPIKPDILMEGGNVLHDGVGMFEPSHPLLSLRTTGHTNDIALTSANATSVATAQAARLAALAMATYPAYWPETIRGLVVHSAEWTPAMRAQIKAAGHQGLQKQQMMLRRYGWGVPREDAVLYSTGQAVTLVVQDEFTPFVGDKFAIPAFRLHDLPWPREVLEGLGSADVTLRVTLSYFIEPTASRRGWRQRYSYASHGLRFELQDPLEAEAQFVQRVNRDARTEEAGGRPATSQVHWTVGANQRNHGSLHQDIWETSGSELAQSGSLAVYPVGGWWKNNGVKNRLDQPVRYALIVSLKTAEQNIDLYTPIANQLSVPVTTPIPIE